MVFKGHDDKKYQNVYTSEKKKATIFSLLEKPLRTQGRVWFKVSRHLCNAILSCLCHANPSEFVTIFRITSTVLQQKH